LCIVETDDIKTTIFRKIKEDSGRQHIIFYNNKERGEDLKEYFEKNGFKSQLFNSFRP
jgi:superfamily II DNA/RNA helicase